MVREREQKTLEVHSQNPFGNDVGALLLNAFRFTFQCVFLIFDTFFMKKGPRRAPGPSKRLKKQQKLSKSPPGGQGYGVLTPFLAKKQIHGAQMGSLEDPQINKNEVSNALFFSACP